jgi:hypothetical protein
VEAQWEVTSSEEASDELDRILANNPALCDEILGLADRIRLELSTNPERSALIEDVGDGCGHGFALKPISHHEEFALLIQFRIFPRKLRVRIANIQLLGPSPPSESANGHQSV